MMYDHCRCKRRRDRRRGEGEIVDSDSKEDRRGEEKNKQTRNYGYGRASERVSDSGITTKGPFFLQKKKKNLRYVDYLLYFMYLLIYL